MSAAELEEMTGVDDLRSTCPVKVVEREALTPIPPEPVNESLSSDSFINPRWWEYRVC